MQLMEGGQGSRIFRGRDQRIRSAKVSVSPHGYLHRPLNLLYPIECQNKGNTDVDSGDKATTQSTGSTENETSEHVPLEDSIEEVHSEETTTQSMDDLVPLVSSTRPIRKATVVARKKIKEWLSPEETMFVWGVSRTAKDED